MTCDHPRWSIAKGALLSTLTRTWTDARLSLRQRPEIGALTATLAIFAIFALWADEFLTRDSAASTLTLVAETAIVAMPMTLLMISGEFDLSVGSVLGVSSMVAPWLIVNADVPPGLAVVASLAVAVTIGFLNGLVVVAARIPSFIVTLGSLLFWRGVLLVVTEGFPVSVPTESIVFQLFSHRFETGPAASFDVSAIWLVFVALILAFVLTHTKIGNWTFAAGGNERAARAVGVPVDRVRLGLFMLTAGAAGLAGLIQASRFNSVDALRGQNLELEAIAAAVIGGTRLNGGYGSVLGTVLGCLMIGMIRNGLALAGVASYWYQAILGLLIVLAVLINRVTTRRTAVA